MTARADLNVEKGKQGFQTVDKDASSADFPTFGGYPGMIAEFTGLRTKEACRAVEVMMRLNQMNGAGQGTLDHLTRDEAQIEAQYALRDVRNLALVDGYDDGRGWKMSFAEWCESEGAPYPSELDPWAAHIGPAGRDAEGMNIGVETRNALVEVPGVWAKKAADENATDHELGHAHQADEELFVLATDDGGDFPHPTRVDEYTDSLLAHTGNKFTPAEPVVVDHVKSVNSMPMHRAAEIADFFASRGRQAVRDNWTNIDNGEPSDGFSRGYAYGCAEAVVRWRTGGSLTPAEHRQLVGELVNAWMAVER